MKRNITALLATTIHTAYANTDATEFTTGVGRIVWGHPLKPQDKTDSRTGAKVLDDSGQPIKQWSFGVAFPKPEFEAAIWPHLAAETMKGYPQGAPGTFSYKYKDGDSAEVPYNNGKPGTPYNQREGYPGHYILTFNTEFQAPNVVQFANGAYHQLQPDQIKTGDFVMVGASAKWHAGQSPGLYINPLTVLMCYEGDALGGSFTADPTQMFGAAPVMGQMPAGARPVGAPAPGAMPPAGTMPGMGQQQMGNGGMPQQGAPTAGMMPGASPAAGTPSYPTQPGQPGGYAAPMSPSNMPPPATDFIPGAAAMPGQAAPGGMPGMPQPR